MKKDTIDTFCPSSQKDWRKWLKANHRKKEAVWLILYKKNTDKHVMTWSDAVDEALCFGWIDSVRRPIDGEKFMQFFGKRKTKGTWSKINKEKVQRLIDEGRMMPAGLESIETARQNGSWAILDDAEALKLPAGLVKAFRQHPGSKSYFMSLSRSIRKQMLQWIALAKREETKQKRIDELAELAAKKQKPKQFV